MSTMIPRTLLACFDGLLAGTAVCFAVAMRFSVKKHEWSGVPINHFAIREEGRPFYVPRMDYPKGQRPRFPLSEEQFTVWQRIQSWSS